MEEAKTEVDLPEIVEPKKNQMIEKKPLRHGSLQSGGQVGQGKIGKSNKIEPPTSADSLQDLVLKNIKLSEAIFEQNKKIKRRLNMMVLGNYLRIVLIIAPLILAYIYLAPLLGQVLSQYGSLLGGTDGAAPNLGSMLAPGKLDINSILKNISTQDAVKIQEMLKNISK